MKVRKTTHGDSTIELQMTPMIDIVFQLLVFFIMTFKIVEQEGDFGIRMPLQQGAAQASPELVLPHRLRLAAAPDGRLASISMDDRPFLNFAALRQYVVGLVGDMGGPEAAREQAEVEIDADPNLRYEYVMQGITAVSGYKDPETGQVVELIRKIKFAPPPPQAP